MSVVKRFGILLDVFVMSVIFAGFCALMYPSASNLVNDYRQSRLIERYDAAVSEMGMRDYADMLQSAVAYNRRLLDDDGRFVPDESALDEYNSLLDVTGTGVMAYLEIPKISLRMAIYHGVDESTLQSAAGHVVGSSLPVGGVGTHIAISGHRGVTYATLFTHLDDLEVGDRFYVQVLGQKMAYDVDRIDVVSPDDFSLLGIDDESDFCTLITCTPYGVNSHRLLIRGSRVPYSAVLQSEYDVATSAFSVNPDVVVVAACALACSISLAVFCRLRFARSGKRVAKRSKRRGKREL